MATDFFAGCVGGAAGVIVGHPLDTVKVRIQTQSADSIKYKGTFQTLIKIAKQESIGGLYKGISSPLYGVSFVNALVFGVYGSLRPFINGPPGNNSIGAHALAGAAAGAAQSVVCSPMELVKIRMQINESSVSNVNSWHLLRSIYKDGGVVRGVYRGYLLTLSREIPGFATYFATYEIMINQFLKWGIFTNNAGQIGTIGMMLAGGSAGSISWIACLPQDVFKTRFQSDTQGQYHGIWDCMRKTYRVEGYQVFTRSLPSLLIRAFPMNAVTFPVVTWIMRFADARKNGLGTSQEEFSSLLEELKMTGTRTQETLYDCLHVPHYRLLKPGSYFLTLSPTLQMGRSTYLGSAIADSYITRRVHRCSCPKEENKFSESLLSPINLNESDNISKVTHAHLKHDMPQIRDEKNSYLEIKIKKPICLNTSETSSKVWFHFQDYIFSPLSVCKCTEECNCPECKTS